MFRKDGTTDLPEEIILKLFLHLTPQDIAMASLVCRAFERFANFSELWKEKFILFETTYSPALNQENPDYKTLYKAVDFQHRFPNVHSAIMIERITDWHVAEQWNARQRSAVERLLVFIKSTKACSVPLPKFFNSPSVRNAAHALKAVIFGQKDTECLSNFRRFFIPNERFGSSKLADIYDALVQAKLITDTLSEAKYSPSCLGECLPTKNKVRRIS